MNILAFDQAFVATGWAFGPSSGATSCGQITVSRSRFDSIGARMMKFEREVSDLMDKYKPDLFVFEAHRAHSAVQAAQVLGGVAMSIMRLSEERKIPYSAAEVTSAKLIFTGTGRASKALVIAVATKKHPDLRIISDNVADALAIHHWACQKLAPARKEPSQ